MTFRRMINSCRGGASAPALSVTSVRTVCAAGVALIAAGCAPHAPATSVKEAYIAERLASVDRTQPCYLAPFEEFPIKVYANHAFVDAWVNGVHTFGEIDTGADETLITPALAKAARVQLGGAIRRAGADGSFRVLNGDVPKIAVGSVLIKHPWNIAVYDFPGSNGVDFGINIGANLLNGLDYDIDFVHGTVRPYATSNCLTIDPPWRTTSTGVALTRGTTNSLATTTAGMDYYHDLSFLHVTIPVAFPGGVIDAVFDTGSGQSLMSFAAARAIGLSRSEIGDGPADKVYGLAGGSKAVGIHHFADMAIGEDELHNFPISLLPHFDRRDTPMIIGMDYMKTHHFWLSYTTDALYIDSGELRKPTPPLDRAHQIAGTNFPAYPADVSAGAHGKVDLSCWVEADGGLTGCRVVRCDGGKAFSDAALNWVTGAAHPVMQPAYVNGKPVRQTHAWSIDFLPPDAPGPVAAK
jgi:TonB family protein